jgi:hypothetical protein
VLPRTADSGRGQVLRPRWTKASRPGYPWTMTGVTVRALWIRLSVVVAALVAAASAAGMFSGSVYARETAVWAAQGMGQDAINLFVVVPALVVCAHLVGKGSFRALLVWLGLLIYVVYSYLMYAFSVHFGPVFPVYVAALGLGFYTLFGSLFSMDRSALAAAFPPTLRVKPAAAYLLFSGVAFSGLWLSEIARALAAGTDPAGLAETGLPVNFVHVEDLGFILPGMIVTSALLLKRKTAGCLFAVPLMVFAAAMGAGIISMFAAMSRRGLGGGGVLSIAMAVLTTASVAITALFLKDLRRA